MDILTEEFRGLSQSLQPSVSIIPSNRPRPALRKKKKPYPLTIHNRFLNQNPDISKKNLGATSKFRRQWDDTKQVPY
jgi:hypothetical protein